MFPSENYGDQTRCEQKLLDCKMSFMKTIKNINIPKAEESEEARKHDDSGFFKMQQPAESITNSSTEDSTTSDSSSDESIFQEMCERLKPKKLPFVKTQVELGLDDLPPIEDLVISVNEGEMSAIGQIYSVVDRLVIVRALKGMKALDLDSVLFLSHEQPLGRIFDVFGPVNEPFYSVRFSTPDQMNEKGVKIGAEIYFVPENSDITSYVFVKNLQNQKGSDASWKNDSEPPEEFLDFSDDEKEKSVKQQRRLKNRNQRFNNSDAPAKRPLLAEPGTNNQNPAAVLMVSNAPYAGGVGLGYNNFGYGVAAPALGYGMAAPALGYGAAAPALGHGGYRYGTATTGNADQDSEDENRMDMSYSGNILQ